MKAQYKTERNSGINYRLTSTLSFILGMLLLLIAEVSCSQQSYWGPDTNFINEPMSYGEAMDYSYGELEQFMSTDVLIDRGSDGYSKRHIFNGQNDSSICTWGDFHAIQTRVSTSKLDYSNDVHTIKLDSMAKDIYQKEGIITLGVVDFKYEEIDDRAKRNDVLQWVNNRIVVQNGFFPNILEKKRTTAFSPLIPFVNEPSLKFRLDSNFFFSNVNSPISLIELQIGHFEETQFISVGETIEYLHNGSDSLHLKLSIHYENGETVNCRSLMFVWDNHEAGETYEGEKSKKSRNSRTNTNSKTIFTYADLAVMPDKTYNLSAAEAIGNGVVTGKVGIYYGCGNERGPIRKPFIVCTGYGPFGSSKIDSQKPGKNAFSKINGQLGVDGAQIAGPNHHSSMNNGSNLLFKLQNEGFDIVIIDPDNGVDFVQNYAAFIQRCLNKINQDKRAAGSHHENVIMGLSMGGIAVRYALADMERQHYASNGAVMHHHCRTFISYEGEMQGATIPMGLQAFATKLLSRNPYSMAYLILDDVVNHAANQFVPWYIQIAFPLYYPTKLTVTKAIQLLGQAAIIIAMHKIHDQLLNNPAAKSMLTAHISVNKTNNDRTLHPHPLFTTLYAELDSLGYPEDCRLVAISNASNNGAQPSAQYGNMLVNFRDFDNKGTFVRVSARLEYGTAATKVFDYHYRKAAYVDNMEIEKEHPIHTSFSSGSYEGFYSHYIMPIAMVKSNNPKDFAPGYRAPFVPISSTFDLNWNAGRLLNYDALDSLFYTAPNQKDVDLEKGYPHNSPYYDSLNPITPFDAVFASEQAEFHVGNISTRIVDFILSEVSPDRLFVQNRALNSFGNYSAKYESRKNATFGKRVSSNSIKGEIVVDSLKSLSVRAKKQIIIKPGFNSYNGSSLSLSLGQMANQCYSFSVIIPKRLEQTSNHKTNEVRIHADSLHESLNCINVYPNPCKSKILIENCDLTYQKLDVLNSHGVTLEKYDIQRPLNEILFTNFPAGVYLLRFSSPTAEEIIKLIKQ